MVVTRRFSFIHVRSLLLKLGSYGKEAMWQEGDMIWV